MMHLKLNKLSLKIIGSFLWLMLGFISCKTGNQKPFVALPLNTNIYYKTSINNQQVILKIDSVGNHISGKYYTVNNKVLLEPNPFTVSIERGFATTKLNNGNRIFGNIKVIQDDLLLTLNKSKNKSNVIQTLTPIYQTRIPIDSSIYKEPKFSVQTRTLKYGSAKGYYTAKVFSKNAESNYAKILFDVSTSVLGNVFMSEQNLEVDVYTPLNFDNKMRPLIVLLHGGAFLFGDKKTETIAELANYYAKLGYVVACPNYRLGFAIVPGSYDYVDRCMYRALQDTRAAIRFMLYNANEFGIDEGKIFIGGTSAGAITALNVAFTKETERLHTTKGNVFKLQNDLGCLDCSSNLIVKNFNISGIINLWGGLQDINLIEADEVKPMISIHGTKDNIVPYNINYPFFDLSPEISSFFSKLFYGSLPIHQRVKSFGGKSKLLPLANAMHEPQIDSLGKFNKILDLIKLETKTFLYETGSAMNDNITGNYLVTLADTISTYSINYQKGFQYNWQITGGISFNQQASETNIIWFKDAEKHGIRLTIIQPNGFVTYKEFDVVIDNNN